MALFGFQNSTHAVQIAGISKWQVLNANGHAVTYAPDGGYADLGPLFGGTFVAKTMSQNDPQGRAHPYLIDVQAKANMMFTDKTTVLALLGGLTGGYMQHKLTLVNGDTPNSGTGYWGLSFKFDSSKDYDGLRFIEIAANAYVLPTDAGWDATSGLWATPPASGTLISGDALYGFSATKAYPAGCSGFQVQNGAAGWETPGVFRNAKVILQSATFKDHSGLMVPFAVNVDMEAEFAIADTTDRNLLDELALATPGVRATLADGTYVTLNATGGAGINWELHNDKDSTDITYVTVKANQIVLPSYIGTLIS
jgi:hypothetical protein